MGRAGRPHAEPGAGLGTGRKCLHWAAERSVSGPGFRSGEGRRGRGCGGTAAGGGWGPTGTAPCGLPGWDEGDEEGGLRESWAPGAAARDPGHSRVTPARLCSSHADHRGRHHARTMLLVRLTSRLLRAAPRAGKRPRGGKAAGQTVG